MNVSMSILLLKAAKVSKKVRRLKSAINPASLSIAGKSESIIEN
jgi:hypothetical protein